MGTQTKINAALKRRFKRLWKQAKLQTFTTTEVLEHLERIRTFYVMAIEAQLADGDMSYTMFCKDMIKDITIVLEKVHVNRQQADVVVQKTIHAQPCLLSPMDRVDFEHLMEGTEVN